MIQSNSKVGIAIFGGLVLLGAGVLSAETNWTCYIYSTNVVNGDPGFCDVTIAIRANTPSDEKYLGLLNISGTMSTDLYDFEEGHNPIIDERFAAKYYMGLGNPPGAYNWKLGSFGQNDLIKTEGTKIAALRFFIKNTSGTLLMNFDNNQDMWTFPVGGDSERVTMTYDNTGGDIALPVQMSQVDIHSNRSGIKILWTTQSELNCYGFHIWRRTFGDNDFVRITEEIITGNGNTTEKHSYSYVDVGAQSDTRYWYKIEEISTDGRSTFYGPFNSQGTINILPKTVNLFQNYPNPFNASTRIFFQIDERQNVSVKICTVDGKNVETLTNRTFEPGSYEILWIANSYPSGVYLIRLEHKGRSMIRKALLLK